MHKLNKKGKDPTSGADGRQEGTTRDTSYRRRNPKDPNVMQGYPNREEEISIIGDIYQKRSDGITNYTHRQNRKSAQNEESQV